jgi:hypothetical protein
VFNVRKAFVTQGLDAALHRKLRDESPTPRKLDGAGEARLMSTSVYFSPALSEYHSPPHLNLSSTFRHSFGNLISADFSRFVHNACFFRSFIR